MTSEIQYFSNRDSLLSANAVLITQLQNRLRVKRFRANENDTSKLEYMKALTEAVKVQNDILESCQLDEIKEEIDNLKGK
jgi:hypothetical protein